MLKRFLTVTCGALALCAAPRSLFRPTPSEVRSSQNAKLSSPGFECSTTEYAQTKVKSIKRDGSGKVTAMSLRYVEFCSRFTKATGKLMYVAAR